MQVEPGASVLDVGCGAGADTIPLAGRVGVDGDREMVARAGSAAEAAGVESHVLHICADASRLPLESARFDCSESMVLVAVGRKDLG